MTVNELNAKLDQLRKENARTQAETEAQQKKKETLELQLKKYQADIAGVQKNERLPAEDKRKRIEELKKQISAHLKLMLAL
jgi:anti-sigma28 factor (negative regulator of flagellin synthesis)